MPSSPLRLRHLRTFVAVARHEGIGRAADDLAVTQPAVSKSMRELETILGVRLLNRGRHGGFLSPYGEVFLRHAQASLAALRRGVEEIEDAAAPSAAPVRVGALPTVSARLLPETIRRYGAHDLGAVPRVVSGPTGYLTAQLRQGDLDIVIGRMHEPDEMTGLLFEHLYSEEIAFVVRPEHPIGGRHPALADLTGFEYLLPPPGSVIRPTVDRFFAAAGLPRPARVVETVSLAFARTYVRLTDAIWVISEGVVLDDLHRGMLARLPLDTSDTRGPVGVSTLAGVSPSLPAEVFLKELRAVATDIRAQ